MKPLTYKKAVGKATVKKVLLYVEDEEENCRVAKLRLKNKYNLLIAPDASEACHIIRTQYRNLEAILMDIELKGSKLDGIMLTKLIRGTLTGVPLPNYAIDFPISDDIPIIFVTAYGNRYSEAELLAAGGNQLIHKPVDFLQLTMALTQVLLERNRKRFESRSPSIPSDMGVSTGVTVKPSNPASRPVILYVGEDDSQYSLAKLNLGFGYELLHGDTFEKTCDLLESRRNEIVAVLVESTFKISHFEMTDMPRFIRGEIPPSKLPECARKHTRLTIPVFALSRIPHPGLETRWRAAGGTRVLRKPINREKFALAVRRPFGTSFT